MHHLNNLGSLVLFAIGETPITLGSVIAGALVIVLGFVAAGLAGKALGRLRQRARHGRENLYIVEKVTTYGLGLIGVVAGLSTMGLDLSSLAVFAGAVGVGVGLGLQGIIKEFVSGLVLVFNRVLNVGDYVELEDGKRGQIREIGPRAVRIRTSDNITLIIPNSKFTEGPVINWTLHNNTSRVHIPFEVAADADRRKVRDVVLAAAHSVPFTLPDSEVHKTQVWLTGFSGSGLSFELVVWPSVDAIKRLSTVKAAYTWAIADALEAAGVENASPQLEVTLRRLFGQEGDQALAALRLDRAQPTRPPRPDRGPADNDAADEVERPLPPAEPDEPDSN